MVVDYSNHAPLCTAIAQALDGSHPCSLCHAVSAGKDSERKSDAISGTPKLDMISAPRAACLMPPFVRFDYPTVSFVFNAGAPPPLVPPPRLLLS
jgi:hypothetical protein